MCRWRGGAWITVGMLVIGGVAQAGTFTTAVSSIAGVHNDYWRGSSYSWNAGNGDTASISGLDCYGGCSWSGDKIFLEMAMPVISGNIVSATFYLNAIGGSGDAWLNTLTSTGLTGNVTTDQSLFGWQFNNSGLRVGPGASGWQSFDVTTGIQWMYSNAQAWGSVSLDPVPWSTSLVIDGVGQNSPYLVITTDSVETTPEPDALSLAGIGLALLMAKAFRRKSH